jgi:hypothetical protein
MPVRDAQANLTHGLMQSELSAAAFVCGLIYACLKQPPARSFSAFIVAGEQPTLQRYGGV